MVARTVARSPDKVALVAGEQRQTYADLDRASARLGAALLRQGIRPLDRVVLQLPNTPEFVHSTWRWCASARFRCWRCARTATPRCAHFIRASGAVAYVVPDVAHHFDYRPMARADAAEFAGLRVFVVGEAGGRADGARRLLAGVAGDDDAAIAAPLATARFEPTDVATMLLSGGTTSLSKLIPRTHEDYVLNARLCGQAGGLRRAHGVHGHPAAGPQLQPGLAGHPGRLLRRRHRGAGARAPTPAEIFRLVERNSVTVIAAVVPLITAWLGSDEPDRFDLSSLQVVQNGGARLAPELRQRLIERASAARRRKSTAPPRA